jgi:hypothetical protein
MLPELLEAVRKRIGVLCEKTLLARFRTLPPFGKVYVDTEVARYLIPFAGRSASKSLRTITRGSRLPLPQKCRTLRFFLWWKNGKNGADRTDIDLSYTMFDEEFAFKEIVSYYNLEGYGGCHSGDIVDAPAANWYGPPKTRKPSLSCRTTSSSNRKRSPPGIWSKGQALSLWTMFFMTAGDPSARPNPPAPYPDTGRGCPDK